MKLKFDIKKIGLKRIDIYIIKKFLGTYFFSIVLILCIAVVFDITEKMDKFYDNNAPLKAIIFHYYANFIPYYMNMFSPLFTFISVIFFTTKMASNTEIIAMLASGISFKRIMLPYFISAFIIALLTFVVSGYIIPPGNKIRIKFENTYINKNKIMSANNVQMEVQKGVIMYIERYEIENNTGYRFSLEKFDGKRLISRLTSEIIKWDSAYHWKVQNYLLRRFDGMRETIKKGMSLDTVINIQPDEFFITGDEAPQLNNFKLSKYLKHQRQRGVGSIQPFEIEYYKRFSLALGAFIMTLIGVSLSSRKVRGGMGLYLGIGLSLSAIYILFSTISASFAVSNLMSSFVAVWLPNFLFIVIGIYLYYTAPK